mgnify:CR=1 FL=1
MRQEARMDRPVAELERLHNEHRELKARLSELNSRLSLTRDEEVERKTIQKLKLQKKDRIAWLEANLAREGVRATS